MIEAIIEVLIQLKGYERANELVEMFKDELPNYQVYHDQLKVLLANQAKDDCPLYR